MSEEKFTKGEWFVMKNVAGSLEVETTSNEYLCISIATDDADCTNGPITLANAHLIAAAPEMYKLLQQFIPCDEDGNGNFLYNDGEDDPIGQLVEPLLAKARGEHEKT